jgi:hypothetical protein
MLLLAFWAERMQSNSYSWRTRSRIEPVSYSQKGADTSCRLVRGLD